jgi:UDP-GlcNAc:undecaprenyl-phosphate GlcNAc-1-phosphate transferase
LISNFTSTTFWLATSVLGPALALGLIGLWDDVKDLPPLPRFIAQSIAGIFTASILIITNNVANPTGSNFFDAAITVFWIVGICNSINFFDNLDGGAAGTVAIISIFLFFIAYDRQQVLVSALAIVTAGATAGFLIWNRAPAKIYMGDAGALFLGIIISVLTIRLSPGVVPQVKSFAIPLALMAVPILDTTVAVTSRIYRGISPFQGGTDHLSHRLVRAGLSRRVTAFTLWALAAFYGALALAIYLWPDTAGYQLMAIGAAAWILKLIYFLRIPSEG